MPKAWSKKDERQYKHIVKSCSGRRKPSKSCKRIAAATVNKQRCKEGRAKSCGGKRVKLRGLGATDPRHLAMMKNSASLARLAIKESAAATSCTVKLARFETAAYNYGNVMAHANSMSLTDTAAVRKAAVLARSLGDALARQRQTLRACLKGSP